MNQLLISLSFVFLEIVCGLAIVSLVYYRDRALKINLENLSLSYIVGCGTSSILIICLDIIGIPLNIYSLLIGHLILLLSYGMFYRNSIQQKFSISIKPEFSLFKTIPILIIVVFGVISIWRTYYYPPYSYDSTIGIDLLAKYAVTDGSISRSRLFEELLPFYNGYTNQLFYAPFTAFMQIITIAFGIDFGQIWLGFLSLFFHLYFFQLLSKRNSSAFALLGTLALLFSPELFAYSFILQTDYSNAIFFFIGIYFFGNYIKSQKNNDFNMAVLGMFLACWSRSETVFFLPFGSLLLVIKDYWSYRKMEIRTLIKPALFTLIPFLAVVLWSFFFIEIFLPGEIDLGKQIDPDFSRPLWDLISDNFNKMNDIVIFQSVYWNYTVSLFFVVVVLTVLYQLYLRDKNFVNWNALFWIVVLYIAFHILLIVFPAVNVEYTFRRGFFKFIVIMTFFIGNNRISFDLQRLT